MYFLWSLTTQRKNPLKYRLTLYSLTSECIFSILFSIHLLRCWQGEFVYQSRVFQAGDHFLYSRDLTAWFRGDSVGRIKMLITSRGWRVNIDGYEENQALRFRRRENDSCKQKGQENTFLGWNAKYSPYFIIYSSTTDRRSTDEIVCHISSHFIFIRNPWRYGIIQINRSLSIYIHIYLYRSRYGHYWS